MVSVAMVEDKPKVKHTRSRFGCRECKRLKMKCDEKKPACSSCERKNKQCDYSVTLSWGGRPYKKPRTDAMLKVPREMMFNQLNVKKENTDVNIPATAPVRQQTAAPLANDELNHRITSFDDSGASSKNSQFLEQLGETFSEYSKTLSESPLDESQLVFPTPAKGRDIRPSLQEEPKKRKPKDYMSKYLKESLAPGIASVTDALGSLAGDHSQYFHLESLSLLHDLSFNPNGNDTISSSDSPVNLLNDPEPAPEPVNVPEDIENIFADFDTYQEDLMKIDRVFDNEHRGLLHDPFGSRQLFHRFSPIVDVSDAEPLEDENDELYDYNKQVRLIHGGFGDSSSSSSSPKSFSIPRGLTPLPDLLLNVPYYLESFHFFRDVTSATLVPAPAYAYKENPFRVVLPRLAMANESILSVLVAFGITHKCFMLGQEEPKEVLDQLLSRCLKDLILLLEDKESSKSDLTLALVLMIGSFDAFTSIRNNWKLHVQGAKQILLKRGLKNPFNKKALESASKSFSGVDKLPMTVSRSGTRDLSVSEFLVGWFTYIDMLSMLATPLKPTAQKVVDLEWKKYDSGNTTAYYSLDKDVEINMFAGFDTRFLQTASELISLIKKTNQLIQTAGPDFQPTNEIIFRAVEVRENMAQVYQSSTEKHIAEKDEAATILRATNELFYLALLIHLYRRVMMVPRESNVIRSLCLKVKKILNEKIETGSNAEICSSFVIFTAAAEVTDDESKQFFLSRLTNQFNIGNYICKKLSDVLKLCWKLDKNWTEIIETYQIDLTFI